MQSDLSPNGHHPLVTMLILSEKSLSAHSQRRYSLQDSGDGVLRLAPTTDSSRSCSGVPAGAWAAAAAFSPYQRLTRLLSELFVPRGKVADEYARFQFLDSVQATCSYLRGILTIHATLVGAGLGTDAAGATSATLSWILKDGTGMLGSLLFSYGFATSFDSEVKFWRLFADVINDIGLTMELLAPLAGPHWFLPVTCTANLCKSLCGVAAGATRVAISQHFACEGNVAEVQAKEGTQETAVSLLGLALGLLLSPYLNASFSLQAAAFAALTIIHVIANYYAVTCLALITLNRGRLLSMLCNSAQTSIGSDGVGTDDLGVQRRFKSSLVTAYAGRQQLALSPSLAVAMDPLVPIHIQSQIKSMWAGTGLDAVLASGAGGGGDPTPSEPCPIRLGCSWEVIAHTARQASEHQRRGSDSSKQLEDDWSRYVHVVSFSNSGDGNATMHCSSLADLFRSSSESRAACQGNGDDGAGSSAAGHLRQRKRRHSVTVVQNGDSNPMAVSRNGTQSSTAEAGRDGDAALAMLLAGGRPADGFIVVSSARGTGRVSSGFGQGQVAVGFLSGITARSKLAAYVAAWHVGRSSLGSEFASEPSMIVAGLHDLLTTGPATTHLKNQQRIAALDVIRQQLQCAGWNVDNEGLQLVDDGCRLNFQV